MKENNFWLAGADPCPPVFVSVASKGLRNRVSLLFATLAVRSISVADKGVRALGQGIEVGLWEKLRGRGERMAATSALEYHLDTRLVNYFVRYYSSEAAR